MKKYEKIVGLIGLIFYALLIVISLFNYWLEKSNIAQEIDIYIYISVSRSARLIVYLDVYRKDFNFNSIFIIYNSLEISLAEERNNFGEENKVLFRRNVNTKIFFLYSIDVSMILKIRVLFSLPDVRNDSFAILTVPKWIRLDVKQRNKRIISWKP